MAQIARRRPLLQVNGDLTNIGVHIAALCNQGYLNSEPAVNAMWNAVLNICYPTDNMEYLIFPEAYAQIGGARADLAVREVAPAVIGGNYTSGQPLAYYEGKSGAIGNGTAVWTNLRAQMRDYLAHAIANTQNPSNTAWAIGAIGTNVCFYRYTARFTGDNRMVPVTVQNGGLVSNNANCGQTAGVYNLATQWASIQIILEHMSQNYAAF